MGYRLNRFTGMVEKEERRPAVEEDELNAEIQRLNRKLGVYQKALEEAEVLVRDADANDATASMTYEQWMDRRAAFLANVRAFLTSPASPGTPVLPDLGIAIDCLQRIAHDPGTGTPNCQSCRTAMAIADEGLRMIRRQPTPTAKPACETCRDTGIIPMPPWHCRACQPKPDPGGAK